MPKDIPHLLETNPNAQLNLKKKGKRKKMKAEVSLKTRVDIYS
jgi:hypothetical protein